MNELEDQIPLLFGKHKGETPEQIAEHDPGYIVWLCDIVGRDYCSRGLYVACSHAIEVKGRTRSVRGWGKEDPYRDDAGPDVGDEHY